MTTTPTAHPAQAAPTQENTPESRAAAAAFAEEMKKMTELALAEEADLLAKQSPSTQSSTPKSR